MLNYSKEQWPVVDKSKYRREYDDAGAWRGFHVLKDTLLEHKLVSVGKANMNSASKKIHPLNL